MEKRGFEPRKSSSQAVFAVVESGSFKRLLELVAMDRLDPNCTNEKGETPLMVAVDLGHKDMVTHLLMLGADANAVDKSGQSVMDHAVAKGNSDAIMALEILGAE